MKLKPVICGISWLAAAIVLLAVGGCSNDSLVGIRTEYLKAIIIDADKNCENHKGALNITFGYNGVTGYNGGDYFYTVMCNDFATINTRVHISR